MKKLLLVLVFILTQPAFGQTGSRYNGTALGVNGKPTPATITICTNAAGGVPCTPLATIYTDNTLTNTATNPFSTDALGNYHFYAPAGRYVIQVSGTGIATYTLTDSILPNDPNNPTFTNIARTGPRPYIDVTAYGAFGKSGASAGVTGSISSSGFVLTLSATPSTPFVVGTGIAVAGAGANGDVLIAGVSSVSGTAIGLTAAAQTTVSGATVSYDDTYPTQQAVNAMCSTGGALNLAPTSGHEYITRAPAQITVSTTSLTSNVVTATLATALPSQIVTGNYAVVAGNSYTGANGTFPVTVVDSTHVTYPSTYTNGTGTGGTISFPSIQIPSTCHDFYVIGGNDTDGTNTQFSRPPKTDISQVGNSLAPMFILTSNQRTSTLEKITLFAPNQALQLLGGAGFNLNDVCLTVSYSSNPAGGTADNTPLAIYNTFWIRMQDGCLVVQSGGHSTQFAAVMALVGNLPQPTNFGLTKFENVIASGGSYLIDNRQATSTNNGGGNFIWDNSQIENSSVPFLSITNTSGTGFPEIGPITIHQGASYDCGSGQPFVLLNSSGTFLGPAWIYTAPQCTAGTGEAILVQAGAVDNIHVYNSGNSVSDSNGNAFGPAIVENTNGMDFLSVNDSFSQGTYVGPRQTGGSLRLVQTGNSQANMGMSAFAGLLFGPGGKASTCGVTVSTICGGYDQSIFRNSTETTDIEYAAALPPTNFAATPTTGGSLANGTYYYYIETGGPVSNTYSNAIYVSTTLTGGNNAVTLTWTAPGGTNPQNCNIFRSSSGTNVSIPYYQISNCVSTNTFTDTGGTPAGTGTALVYNQTLAPFYHFAANSTNPTGGTVPYYTGGPTSGDCASWGSAGKLTDAGFPCKKAASGSCAMSSSTSCTVTLPFSYTTPICAVSVQSATVIAGGCTVSGTTATVTAASSNSSTWGVIVRDSN